MMLLKGGFKMNMFDPVDLVSSMLYDMLPMMLAFSLFPIICFFIIRIFKNMFYSDSYSYSSSISKSNDISSQRVNLNKSSYSSSSSGSNGSSSSRNSNNSSSIGGLDTATWVALSSSYDSSSSSHGSSCSHSSSYDSSSSCSHDSSSSFSCGD